MTKDSLRVLMISDVYFPRINGVSTSIETFRRDLGHHGVRVTLVAPDYPQRSDAPDIHRVRSRQLPFDPEDRLMHWGELQRTTQRLGQHGFDLVHIQTPFSAHYAGLRAARHLRVPAVATYHTHFEEYFHHYLPALPRRWLRAAARRVARAQCNALNAVVVPSQAMRRTLADYGVTAPMHVLSTGIPIERFQRGDRLRFRAMQGIPADRRVALFVGRVAHEKNIGFLLDAVVHLKQRQPAAMLVVAGEGPALPSLQQRARALGLDSHVRFVGYLDRATELPDCYAAADVFVFSSKTETQGLVLLEAMAAGLPCYALAEMGTRDILEPQRGAVVAKDEPAAFADGLAHLLDDRPRLAQLAYEARRYANEWSAPERARQLAALYRSIVGR
ncbi:MAG TPA: glycosyltransferase [Rhodocyclaceae bacterium]